MNFLIMMVVLWLYGISFAGGKYMEVFGKDKASRLLFVLTWSRGKRKVFVLYLHLFLYALDYFQKNFKGKIKKWKLAVIKQLRERSPESVLASEFEHRSPGALSHKSLRCYCNKHSLGSMCFGYIKFSLWKPGFF